jgi:hypothetical protein
MPPKISIGNQSFEYARQRKVFYIDKTNFIKEWWECDDVVTLINRPRRFGKTLNLNMMNCFFSTTFSQRGDLFEGLSIWDEEEYRKIQGTWPVISLSFAGIKSTNFQDARDGIVKVISDTYKAHRYLKDSDVLNDMEKADYDVFQKYSTNSDSDKKINATLITSALNVLAEYLERYHGKKVLIFLDEYDTPLQEAYVYGYWKELVEFIRELFNNTFKTNEYLYRAILTGITRVSKESIFSDLNNLEVVTTTSEKYCTSFGFTEEEVFGALDERGLSDEKENVKFWYDGFVFGNKSEIYNPWSISKYLDSKKYGTYWADTSSNALVSTLFRQGDSELKMQLEDLLEGKALEVIFDEQVIFEQLEDTPGAVFSLLMASGYLKPVSMQYLMDSGESKYQLKITNNETLFMFRKMVSGWFSANFSSYGNFKKALVQGDLKYMNRFMNDVARVMFSSFDSGNKPSEAAEPERFYHGFVLGLVVDLAGKYHIRSNRESGFGRYDVIMEPKNPSDDAIIMEFKVHDEDDETSLEDTVANALKQIEEKAYDSELIDRNIPKGRIRRYGFAFQGKKVLIGDGSSRSARLSR